MVIVADCPDASGLRLHGYAPVHAPLLLTKVMPAGSGSVTTMELAVDGPRFVTVTV